MKIALLTDGIFPYVIGGMQKHSYQLAKQLAQNGHTVYLFHCNESTRDISQLELFTDEEKKNIHSFVIPFPHKNYYPFHYITESRLYSKAIYAELAPILPEIDFVFAQGFCAWELLKNKQDGFPPIAVHFHGLEMFQHIPGLKSKLSSFFLRNVVKQNLALADYTISFGGKLTYLLAGIIPVKKIWEIPGGIDSGWVTNNINPVKNEVNFVFLGRYERRKGIKELNIALQRLLGNKQLPFSFTFIGDIPEEHKIKSPQVHYQGQVEIESEIAGILSQSDVLVAPSYAEGMPIAIMEAMAQGLAVIATDVGSVSTLVDSSNGWLLPTPSPQNIAEVMTQAIKEKNNLQAKKERSLQKIKDGFLLETATNKLIKLMEENTKR